MGFAIHNIKREVDKEKHLHRLHKTVPWIETPLLGADHTSYVFSQRHEANTAELFFDLFFVANLATFTTYHSITDESYLIAYVGFFGILWSCWFQVTLHDVRFARDSLYERACKLVQFIVFVGLALVGSGFNPAIVGQNNTNFRILCYTLLMSRFLLTVQYSVVLFFVYRERYSKLYLPLVLMVVLYATAAGIFGAMTPAFRAAAPSAHSIYVVWYIVMGVESFGVIAISSIWRMLSFKKTHLMERMSLLTLVVIGEGAIGVTKTVSRLMGKYGLDVEGCFLVMCIICTLILIWALYFDNFPHGHYGTIRQQIWSLLHFPFQLAIVGIVEGSQQLALARYVMRNWQKITLSQTTICLHENLDGAALRDALLKLLSYWDFKSKYETYSFEKKTADLIYRVGNTTNICSAQNATSYNSTKDWPDEFKNISQNMFDGVYIGLGMKIPAKRLEIESAQDIAIESWQIVYLYYWLSFCALIACSIIFLVLIRRHRIDLFDYISIGSRIVILNVGIALIALIANQNILYLFLRSPAILPVLLVFLFLILLSDKIGAVLSNRRLLKSGKPYALEYEEEHHSNGGHSYDVPHEPEPSILLHEASHNKRKSTWGVNTAAGKSAHSMTSSPVVDGDGTTKYQRVSGAD
ncbi:hypothetical protein DM02DRAFT_583701 [Periconia macrospinosa]|uniref:Low temperature requirement A n=1 Tax=Periconia macrospinosa TaxID=97972 RepID=A0A2V1E6D1_9PLEO|nr:hypothetical protein DM02DRAFT_583701 [Periconia macrospinosa]